MSSRPPLRALQVIGSLDPGGIETWLLAALRHLDARRLRMDFAVQSRRLGCLENEVLELGGRVLRCTRPHAPWRYGASLERILERAGPYDIVHGHLDHYSGFVLALAAAAGVPVRIAHAHNDKRSVESGRGPLRAAYLASMKSRIRCHATAGLAASDQAAESLFGSRWREDPRFHVLPCGVDLSPFEGLPPAEIVRQDLGIPRDAALVVHVGSFGEQKNHRFLVEVAGELVKRSPRAVLLLVGGGPLEREIRELVAACGLERRFFFAGRRPDVPRLLGAADAFVFPSLYEGLGLALVEAQAAGLRCVVSDRVPRSAGVVAGLVERIPLTGGAEVWAAALARALAAPRADRAAALAAVRDSSFAIERSAAGLLDIYERSAGRGRKERR